MVHLMILVWLQRFLYAIALHPLQLDQDEHHLNETSSLEHLHLIWSDDRECYKKEEEEGYCQVMSVVHFRFSSVLCGKSVHTVTGFWKGLAGRFESLPVVRKMMLVRLLSDLNPLALTMAA